MHSQSSFTAQPPCTPSSTRAFVFTDLFPCFPSPLQSLRHSPRLFVDHPSYSFSPTDLLLLLLIFSLLDLFRNRVAAFLRFLRFVKCIRYASIYPRFRPISFKFSPAFHVSRSFFSIFRQLCCHYFSILWFLGFIIA
jgi:hypothetical protein